MEPSRTAPTGAYIAAVDYALPARQVSNAELALLHPEWKMDAVSLRTGVQTRHWFGNTETALDLAYIACQKLIARLGFDIGQIDALLFCTRSPDHIMPPNACLLQHRLGLPHTVAALDYSLACSGFVYGLYLAKALVQSAAAKHVLLVTAETHSKWSHPGDRGPTTLFGDGAAATLVSGGEPAIGLFTLGTDGSGAVCVNIPAGGARLPSSAETARQITDPGGNVRTAEHIFMNGPALLDFVKKEIPPLVRALLDQAGLRLDDVDLILFHQGSKIILDCLYETLHIPIQKQFSNLAQVGNVSSASIPIALRDAELKGLLNPGMRVMLVAFGAGLSWGGCIVQWK